MQRPDHQGFRGRQAVIRTRLIRILLSVGLLALVLALADWRAVLTVLRDIQPGWLGLGLLLALLDRLVITWRFRVFLAARGIASGFFRLLRVQLAANFFGSFLPSSVGVDALRIAALSRTGDPPRRVVAATLADRLTLFLSTLVFASLMVVLQARDRLPASLTRGIYLITAVALLLLVFGLYPAVRSWVRQRVLSRLPLRFREFAMEAGEATLAYRNETAVLTLTSAVTLGLFGIRIAFAKAVAYSCGVNIPFGDLLLVIPVLWVAVMVPITIGGIGVQDAGYVVLMGLLGVSAPVAASMSLVEHVISRAASLPGAAFLGEFSKKDTEQPLSHQRNSPLKR
jgi:uncharacterized protein (TIRG00374 family)